MIDKSLKYLRDRNLLKMTLIMGSTGRIQNFTMCGLPNKSIDLIENKKEFKKFFGTTKGWKKR